MPLLKSVMVQMRVIYALMIRELHTRYGRENIGFLWIIGEPILFCGGVSILWTIIRPPYDNGVPMTAFVVTGYVPLTLWRHCVGRAVKAFDANSSLLYHRHVTPIDIIVSRTILEIGGTIMAGLIVTLGAIILGYMKPPVDISMVYVGLAYQCAFGFASALIISALSEMSDLVEKIIGIVMYLSIPFSGAFIMTAWLPKVLQNIALYSPSVQATEMIRQGEFGASVKTMYQYGYATYSIAGLTILGVLLTARVRKHILVY